MFYCFGHLLSLLQFNLLYVGGRPSTREFRFRGNISNLFIGSEALTAENIARLHQQALAGNEVGAIDVADSSVRYCYQSRRTFEQCYVDSFEINDFK